MASVALASDPSRPEIDKPGSEKEIVGKDVGNDVGKPSVELEPSDESDCGPKPKGFNRPPVLPVPDMSGRMPPLTLGILSLGRLMIVGSTLGRVKVGRVRLGRLPLEEPSPTVTVPSAAREGSVTVASDTTYESGTYRLGRARWCTR